MRVGRHGIPWVAISNSIPYNEDGGRYLAFLGRIAPEKRPDLAIAAAKQAGIRLKIAAKVDPVDREYFEREIERFLDHPLIEYLGEIGDADKPEFLGDALALLFPIDWPEPFGLVMIEAMACGTPVIARPFGSVPEIVDAGRTGFWPTRWTGSSTRSGASRGLIGCCRRHVEARFTVQRMADEYEAIYGTRVALLEPRERPMPDEPNSFVDPYYIQASSERAIGPSSCSSTTRRSSSPIRAATFRGVGKASSASTWRAPGSWGGSNCDAAGAARRAERGPVRR